MNVYYGPNYEQCNRLLDPIYYAVTDNSGRILLKSSAFSVLPSPCCLRVDAFWNTDMATPSAEHLKGMVKGIGILDTVGGGLVGIPVLVQLGSSWSHNIVADTYTYENCTPNLLEVYDHAYIMGASYQLAFVEGAVRAQVYPVSVDMIRHLPEGTTIDYAWVEIVAPPTMEYVVEKWIYRPDTGSYFVPPVSSPTMASPTAIIVGKTVGSNHYNAYLGTAPMQGSLTAGKKRVLDCTALMRKVMTLLNSGWEDIGITIGGVDGFSNALSDPAGCKAIGYAMIQGWFSSSFSGSISGPDYYTEMVSKRIQFDTPFMFGAAAVKYTVPDQYLREIRLEYSNFPPMG